VTKVILWADPALLPMLGMGFDNALSALLKTPPAQKAEKPKRPAEIYTERATTCVTQKLIPH
jgi:hypothetical protein